MLDEFDQIAAAAWDSQKSDWQRRVEAVLDTELEEKPATRYRIWGLAGRCTCRLCGRADKWTIENEQNPVFVCEWDCEEHAPIEAGRLGMRQVDSVSAGKIIHFEEAN